MINKSVEPILKITESLVNYAKGTLFKPEILEKIHDTTAKWREWKKCFRSLNEVYNLFRNTEDLKEITALETNLTSLTQNGLEVIYNILSFGDIEELATTDVEVKDLEEALINTGDDSLRLNKEQNRNLTALNVLKQIRVKLEGRSELKKGVKIGVSEQVDGLIKDAMDVDKLSMMFEGWMGWI
jgi:phosphatidylinositol kinase/protein kinase (PI-3  family)